MLSLIIILDFLVVFICVFILLRTGDLVFGHPATTYLIFHLLVVTVRLLMLSAGAPTMFDDPLFRSIGFAPVTLDEIMRAAVIADLALFVSTIGFVVAHDVQRRRERQGRNNHTVQQAQDIPIDPTIYLPILWVTLVIGIIGFVLNSYLPGSDIRFVETLAIGEWARSSWIFITQTWIGVALIGFIYVYGFRRFLVILLIIYFMLQLYQGYHRFRILMPLILLTNVYLLQRGLRWPRKWMIALGIVAMLLFFPAKHIGRLMQEGASFQKIANMTADYLINLPTRATSDLVFLDQFAVGLTLVDRAERFYLGAGYLPLVTLPIPRPLWPDKPEIAFFMREIQTAERPIGDLGMIITYLGESYVNFGMVGVIVIPYLLAYFLGRVFYRSQHKPYNTITKLIYIITASSLILVYRDGLTSLLLFTVVNYIPIALIVLLHILFSSRKSRYALKMPDGFLPIMKTRDLLGDER